MKRSLLVLGLATVGVSANAAIFTYTAALNGFQEVPSVQTQAVGVIVLTVDDVAQTFSGTGDIWFLQNNPTMFHIHVAPFGSNGPVRLNIGPGAISAPAGPFSQRSVNFTLGTGALVGTTFAALKSNLDNNQGYFNIHTDPFPGGEIRGQIAPVPEPGTLAALGLGAVALLRRRRAK